jgi:hypothetical protein
MEKLNVQAVVEFREAIRLGLDNAADSGYDELDDRPEDIADNMVQIDADLEVFGEVQYLLVPYIEEWQREQRIRIKEGRSKE